MARELRESRALTIPFRVLFGLVAVATLFSSAPWDASNPLSASAAYAGSLMWGAIAVLDDRGGWRRHLVMSVAVLYLVLSLCKLAGFGA